MNTKITRLAELVENASEASKFLIQSEIYLNDGELSDSQKATMNAVAILNTLKDDVFEEVAEEFELDIKKSDDCDMSALNLAYCLADVCHCGGVLLGMLTEEIEDRVVDIAKTKLARAIANSVELFENLYC